METPQGPKAPKRLRAQEAAERLGIALHTLRYMTRKGKIPCLTLGRLRLYDPAELDRFITENGAQRAA